MTGPATVPWPRRRRPVDPTDGFDEHALHVFVPAIMSVGLLFSIATLARDAMRRTTGRSRERRIALETATTVNDIVGRAVQRPDELGLLSRWSYGVSAGIAAALSGGVVAAVVTHYASSTGGRDRGWLLALGLCVAVVVGKVAVACGAVAVRWPATPAWTMPYLRGLPLTHHPARRASRPRRLLTDAVLLGVLATAALTWLAKRQRGFLARFDEPVLDAVTGLGFIGQLSAIDVFGSTVISIGSVAVIGLSGFRCRVMALVYPAAFVVSWLSTTLLQELVERTRPTGFGQVQSFPSGHMVQAVFIAGLLPTALAVLFGLRQRSVIALRAVLGLFVLATALLRIHGGAHWPSDALAGALLGLTVVTGAHWVVAHRWWHQRCSSCRWSPHPDETPWERSVYDLPDRLVPWLGRAGVASAIGASVALFAATVAVGLPASQADDGLGPEISEPAQLVLALLVGVAGLLAIRWKATAAFLIAFGATALGLLASIEYEPPVVFGLTLMLLVPAVLVWLAWQHHATVGAIFALAVLTATSLTGTALGSREIHGHYFGPTHPGSAAAPLDSAAEWLWLGGVTPTEATVVAGGLEPDRSTTLLVWPSDPESTAGRSTAEAAKAIEVVARADADGVARFDLAGLSPATRYDYAVERPGGGTAGQPADRAFRTFDNGPQDVTVVAGSCARSGSNGAVFDRIVGLEPDLFISLGDMHYADLESTDPADHLDRYARVLAQAGPSVLYGSVPTAYVWDDHDYGANDADRFSPSRMAVSEAYRQAVPHYGVDPDPDGPIAQAFTIGRIRFVLSDTRSKRDDSTMLGAAQLDWLIDELVSGSASHGVVVWVNPTPWISAADASGDDWSSHPEERRRIADALAEAEVDNLLMISGDAHMVAIDDGTNSGYASDGSPGFPVLHAAALDRPGRIKGGPYSHGAVAGGGQFGRLELLDDGGDRITVRLTGETWDGQDLLTYQYDVPVDPIPES